MKSITDAPQDHGGSEKHSLKAWLFAPPYRGVPWLCWLYIVICFLYAGSSAFHGKLAWFDDNVRMVQILEWVNGVHGWYDHVLMRVNAPEGFRTIWSRLIDLPYAAIIIAFQNWIGQKQAVVVAVTVIPMIEVLMLFYASAYFVTPLVGRDKALLVSLFVLCTQCIYAEYYSLAGFEMGAVSHHAWYILLGLTLFGSAIRLLTAPDRKTISIMVASGVTLLLVGIEAFPLLAATGAALAWLVYDRRDTALARRTAITYGMIAIIAALAQPINHPPSEWLKVSFAEPSILGPALAAAAVLFFALEKRIVGNDRLNNRSRIALLLVIAAGIGVGLITLFPQMLDGAAAGLTPEERALASREHTEATSIYHIARDTIDYIRTIMPTLMGFLWGRYLLRKGMEPHKRPIIIYYMMLIVITFLYASVFSRLVFYMSLSACAMLFHLWLDLSAHVKKDWAATLKKTLIFFFLVPLWFVIIPARNYAQSIEGSIFLFPAKRQYANRGCDTSGIGRYLNQHYSNDKTIITPMYVSDRFLYWSDLKVYFLANFPSQNKFIKAQRFFATPDPDEAYQIAADGHINLIAICTDLLQDDLKRSGVVISKTFEQQLVSGEIPTWLKPVTLNFPTSYLLFEVVGSPAQ